MNKRDIRLKSCPFCDGQAELVHEHMITSFVICKTCGAMTKTYQARADWCSDEMASEAWNKRA